MRANFPAALDAVLRHEGGFVDHPDDPGGATNKGITIGTLKRIGIDVDGDGDSDLADLKALRRSDVERVYRLFYWDAVKADLLPSGVDYAVFDFAVNSGVSRAAKALQRILGVEQDSNIGPKTLAALAGTDAAALVTSLCDGRMQFLKAIKGWRTFGRGWTARVDDVRAMALRLAKAPPVAPVAPPPAPSVAHDTGGGWAGFFAALWRLLTKGKTHVE